MTTFGVDLTTHANESGEEIPYIVHKCIAEVEEKGYCMKVKFLLCINNRIFLLWISSFKKEILLNVGSVIA